MLLLKIIWLYESCLFTCTFYIQTNLIVQTIWNSFFVKRCALFLNQRVNIFFYELLIRNGNGLFVLCKPKKSLNCVHYKLDKDSYSILFMFYRKSNLRQLKIFTAWQRTFKNPLRPATSCSTSHATAVALRREQSSCDIIY